MYAAALDFTAAGVLFVLSCFEHSRSVTPSTIIGLYLFISFSFDAARLRTFYLIQGHAARSIANLSSLALAFKFAVLVTEAVEKRAILLEPYRDLPPEATSGIYNKSVFWWLNPLLRIGFGKTLRVEDLYNLDEKLASASVHERFRRKWTSIKDHDRLSLLLTTADVLKGQIFVSAIPRLCLSAAKFVQPFLVQETIRYVGNRDDQTSAVGWGLAGAFFLSYFAQTILTAAYQHLLNRCTTQIRGGLVSLLYQKTLELSIATTDPAASLTLMSTDIQRMVDTLGMIHDTWCSIIDVGVAMFLLYRTLGRACYAPAVVYVLLMMGTAWVTKVISQFQTRWLHAVQVRITFTSALLHSIRNIKLLGMSSIIKDRTQGLRMNEINECKRYRLINNVQILLQNGAGVFAPFATFLLYYLQSRASSQPLDLATAFSILTILRLVEYPLNVLLYSCPQLASSVSCFERIQRYLLSDSRHDDRLSLTEVYDSNEYWESAPARGESIEMRRFGSVSRSPADEALSLKNCSFGWKKGGQAIVQDMDLSVQGGTITMIIGPVGCGKSTLLKGILSETPLSRGFVYLRNSSIAFADQEPWIQNGTIKDTICGPSSWDISPADERWYQEVIACCGLAEDLKAFPKGDLALIGSKVISLSGGQKQRLAVARAVYSRAELLVLDDVFSGLDNDTEELIFKRLFDRSGPLRTLKTTIILVTHAVHRLPYADLVVSLDENGRVTEQGSYISLVNGFGYVHNLDVRVKQRQQQRIEEEDGTSAAKATKENKPLVATASVNEDDENAQDLIRRTGEWATYKHWFRSSGYLASALSMLWGFIWISALQTPGVLVEYFSDDNGVSTNGSSPRSTTFIVVFGATAAIAALALMLIAWQVFLDMQPRSAKNLHLHLLETVLDAPLSFHTRTDSGTIINRFSQDMALVDSDLPFAYADMLLSFVGCVTGIALMAASGAGYFAATIPVLLAALYGIQKYYLRTSRQLRLLDLEEKAPLYTMFGETAAGLASIRAFGWSEKFAERHLDLLDRSQRPFYLMFCIQRWLGIVLDLIVTVLVTILMVIVVARRASIDPGLVGLGLLSTINLSVNLTNLVRTWTALETSIGAISRLKDFVRTTESEHKSQEVEVVRSRWPENGDVVFAGYGASYSEDSDLVLKDIDLNVRQGEKVGVCGRTGSGKSSMLASLFHLLEFRSGQVHIDGVDIATVPRETLRAKLNVIPQEPWWVSTETVRFNMNPWNATNAEFDTPPERRERDMTCISALSRCQIWRVIQEKGGLDAVMTPDFLSHGQRQLFCLARAMMRRSKLVVLDEVSASVDVKTDELMQRIIREHFEDCTVIAVAHRLNTIDDSDRVVVLSQGMVVEVGEPKMLLSRDGSRFRELYER